MATETENKTPVAKRRTARKSAAKKSTTPERIVLVKKPMATDNPYVGISRSVATASIIMTALVLIISPGAVWILGPVIGAMAIFGIAMGYFSSK